MPSLSVWSPYYVKTHYEVNEWKSTGEKSTHQSSEPVFWWLSGSNIYMFKNVLRNQVQ